MSGKREDDVAGLRTSISAYEARKIVHPGPESGRLARWNKFLDDVGDYGVYDIRSVEEWVEQNPAEEAP